MKMRHLLALGVAGAVLTACGSATANITFKAPANYQSKASIGPFMKIWEGPAKGNLIMVMSLPVAMDLNKTMSQSTVKDAHIEKRQDLTICSGQRAIYAEMQGKTSNAGANATEPSEIQFIATDAGGKTYMAMYVRPLKTPVDPAASAAIRNLCPKA